MGAWAVLLDEELQGDLQLGLPTDGLGLLARGAYRLHGSLHYPMRESTHG